MTLRLIELTTVTTVTVLVTNEIITRTTRWWALKKAAEYAVEVLRSNIIKRLEMLLKTRVITPEIFQGYLDKIAKLATYADLTVFFESMNLRYPAIL